MKRPSMYQKHEESLSRFVDLFNNTRDNYPVIMQIYQTENFRDDGVIVDSKTGKRITFDWEIRDKYFSRGKFKFSTLGQFERKIKKDEIGLSLQCDKEQTAVLVAWHQDWLKEKPQPVSLKTDSRNKEKGMVRMTRHFKIYPYANMVAFRAMIYRALRTGRYDHRVFDV